MSEENVEIVRRMYEAYIRGDADRSLEHFHPDVVADFSVRVDTGISRGREQLAKVVSSWMGAWDQYLEEMNEIRDLGDSILVVSTQRGRGKGSGVELSNQFASLYEVEGGLITRVTMYATRADALEAAGLSQ
jgi:ketosteroid isomerase-like protein